MTNALNRFNLILLLIYTFLFINFFTRTILLLVSFQYIDLSFFQLIQIYGVGAFYDFVASSYMLFLLTIYLLMVPNIIYKSKIHTYFIYLLLFIIIYLCLFNIVSEWLFWQEFGKRFNFIAVDYLVYTHEVLNNILESYPIPMILSSITIVSIGIVVLIVNKIRLFKYAIESKVKIAQRAKVASVFLSLPILFFYALDNQPLSKISTNIYNNELAKNGLYSLFSAFRHNRLDYDEYYKTKDIKKVMLNLDKLEGFNDKKMKNIIAQGEPKPHNIILIMVESLSAEFMGAFGDNRRLTPYLDELSKKSLFFTNFYATGTRTVRGMEAVTLSVPPTPGRSIVKRPDNHGMDSVGFIFRDHGYENKFIYAGYGYFDNMNDFFSHNGFNIVDRTDMSDSEITFANIWGVCDEDLLDRTLKEADKSYAKKKPFFNYIMTTSNHRPYTYPNGKIDIPSHTGRSGGVKYTDYAIHDFMEKAKKKPWFDDTIFVILADHNGGSAGKISLPAWRYKIPLIVYAPKIIKPKNIHKLSSQVDLMPTLMSMLNFSYKGMFYGSDILNSNFKQRAFIGNYQKLGLLRDDKLTILMPNKSTIEYRIEKQTLKSVRYKNIPIDKKDELDIITYYQSASYLYDNHINRIEKNKTRFSTDN